MIRIGKTASPGDAVDALLDCHARIREFTALALRLAGGRGLSAAEVREAAAGVHRYFTLALPLHARDEEESILPRLRGLDPALDRELAEMRREHGEHGDAVARVLAACEALGQRPEELPRLAAALASAAGDLERHFAVHLEREERSIFPALRARLDREALSAIQAEMRARRG